MAKPVLSSSSSSCHRQLVKHGIMPSMRQLILIALVSCLQHAFTASALPYRNSGSLKPSSGNLDSSDSSNNEVETNNNAGRAADLSEVLAYFLSRGENGLVSEAERLREAQEARRERILQELRDLTPVESEGGATRGGPLQRGPFRSRQVEAMRPKRRGSCMFHAGLAHNCDYRDVVGAVNEVSHWGSDISPGKRRRRRKRALEEPIYNENGIDLLEEAEENEH